MALLLAAVPAMPSKELFDLWSKYEDIAMHFNGLLIQFRIQALAGLAALATIALVKSDKFRESSLYRLPQRKELVRPGLSLPDAFVLLMVVWLAIWALDYFYYRPLLEATVEKLVELEKSSGGAIGLSTHIERFVGPWGRHTPDFFYALILAVLVAIPFVRSGRPGPWLAMSLRIVPKKGQPARSQ